jgi:outer membrane protein TolC
MRSKILYAALFFGLLTSVSINTALAQNGKSNLQLNYLTLDKAVQWAVSNSPTLAAKRLKMQQEEQELSRVRLSKIPDLSLSGDLRRNIIIPSTPIPASIMNPEARPDEMLYLKFNTGWNSTAGLNLTFDIFNPASYRQTIEQKLQNRISSYDVQISENDIRAEVAKSYAACVISQDQVESLRDDTAFYSKSLAEAQILYSQEKISMTDKNNIVIAYNTSILKFHNAENVLSESKVNLLYLLGEEASAANLDSMQLSENIPALYSKMNPEATGYVNGNLSGASPTSGSDLSRQSEVVSLAHSRIRSSNLKNAPSFSLKGFYGSNYYSNEFNLSNTGFWHGNSYIALSLNMPISQNITLRKETSQLKLQEQIERENLRDLQNSKSKELMDARKKLIFSMKEYELLNQNYDLSLRNLESSRAQLDKGYIQEKDYLEEQARCRNAYQSFLQAAYNVFINTIDLKKLGTE